MPYQQGKRLSGESHINKEKDYLVKEQVK